MDTDASAWTSSGVNGTIERRAPICASMQWRIPSPFDFLLAPASILSSLPYLNRPTLWREGAAAFRSPSLTASDPLLLQQLDMVMGSFFRPITRQRAGISRENCSLAMPAEPDDERVPRRPGLHPPTWTWERGQQNCNRNGMREKGFFLESQGSCLR